MSRYTWALCAAVALVASVALADERAVLVPEGEPDTLLIGAKWDRQETSTSLAFSQDGQLLATGGEDGRVRLWNVTTGRELRILEGHRDDVLCVAFSRDRQFVASGGKDGQVLLWKVETGERLSPRNSHTRPVQAVAFSPDGSMLASAGDDGTLQLWKLGAPKPTGMNASGPVLAMAFSPDGKTLAWGGSRGLVERWSLEEGRHLPQLRAGAGEVQSVAFGPDSLTLAAGLTDGAAWLWEGNSESKPWLFERDSKADIPSIVSFSQGGRILAIAGFNGTVRLERTHRERDSRSKEDGPRGVQVMALTDRIPLRVSSVAFSPDGRALAWGLSDQSVRITELAGGGVMQRLLAPSSPVSSVAFSPSGRLLASGHSDKQLRLWDLEKGHELRRMYLHTSPVRAVAFKDEHTVASGGDDGWVHLWNLENGLKFSSTLKPHSKPVLAVALHPRLPLLASAGDDDLVQLWSTEGRLTPLHPLKGYGRRIFALAFHPAQPILATAGEDGMVRLLNVDTKSAFQPLRCHSKPVRSLAFSPNGRILASSGDDEKVCLWEVGSKPGSPWRALSPLTGAGSSIQSITFSKDGGTLAAAASNGTVRLWSANTWRVLHSLQAAEDPDKKVLTCVAFSPDGKTLATAGEDGAVQLWAPFADDKDPIGLLRGGPTGWLVHLRGRPLYRHDDGRFLYQQDESGALQAVLPPQGSAPPRLSLSPSALAVAGDFGAEAKLTLNVSNAPDAGPAYWLRVEPAERLPPGLVLLWSNATVPAVAPDGKSVAVPLGLSYVKPEDEDVPESVSVRLKLIDASGAEFPVEAPLRLATPRLTVVGEPYFAGKTLTVTLKNEGTQETGEVYPVGILKDPHGKVLDDSQWQTVSLAPDQEKTVSITPSIPLPRVVSFTLKANYERWPRTLLLFDRDVKVPLNLGMYVVLGLGALLLFGSVYYARIYRNPMVVHAARSPSALKNYPLDHMVAADHALRRAKRLDSTITAAGIPATRWQRALCGAREPRDAASAFAEAIGGRLGASLTSDAWALSLPPLRLRFSRDTAVVVIDGTRLESGEAERLMADIFQDGRGPSQVLVLDRTTSQNARQVLEGVPRVRSVVLSANRLRDLLLAEEPVRLLETTISEQVAVSELSPYQVAGGVKLDNLFFGREREVRAIADRTMRNFLVVGQRQMGKSSLLLAVLRRLQARSDLEAQYVELADADLHRRLARARERMPADGAPLPPFEEIAAGVSSRPRVWLIDEADDFISADARAGYPVLQSMRALAEEGRAYFILAGFWDLYRAVVLDEKQPLRNFGEHLRLEPLDERSALALVTEPMTALSLQWDAPSTPEFLVAQAGRRANLLVLSCKALVESLPADTHVLTREHLERAFREDKDLRDQGRRWRGDHPLHRAVVRQALLLGGPTREEVRQALKARGADIRSADFDEAMDHRELSYVLVPDGEGRLYCPVPLMQRYIESERGLEAGLAEDLEDLRRRGLAEVPKPA